MPSRPQIGPLAAAALALSLGGLAACAPDLGPASKIRPASDYAVARTFKATATDWPAANWWTVYNDPQLTGLIEQALKTSPDLKAVQARLFKARARAEQAGAGLGPNLTAKGSVQETGVKLNFPNTPSQFNSFLPNDPQPFTQVSANLSYQLDFFGRNHAALAAAASEAQAQAYEEAAARLQLSTAVAIAYADLMKASADEAAAQSDVELRAKSTGLVRDRLKNGLENVASFSQAFASQATSDGDLIAAKGAELEARFALAALVGLGPDSMLALKPTEGLQITPVGLPANLGANLIGRRPDVAAARLRVEAAARLEKVARADFYPNVNMAGSLMLLSMTPQELLSHNLQLAQVGPAVSLPLFDSGRLSGALRGARGDYEEAVANYDKTVATALREVADAITIRKGAQESVEKAEGALKAWEKGYEVARLRYGAGLITYLNVMTTEDALVDARRRVADLKAQSLGADVSLTRALGGGFVDPTAPVTHSNP